MGKDARKLVEKLMLQGVYPPTLQQEVKRQRVFDCIEGSPNKVMQILEEKQWEF